MTQTPCTNYDIAQLRDHVIGWPDTFEAGFADPDSQAPRETLDRYQAPADTPAAIRAASGTLISALRDGAASHALRLGDTPMPGDMALSVILWEYQVHGWDLAWATGQPWSPPAAAAGQSLTFAPTMLTGDYQGEGKPFAPPAAVPESAPAYERLLGLSGRDPGWRPEARQRGSSPASADSMKPRPGGHPSQYGGLSHSP